jgi:hypothetical protein
MQQKAQLSGLAEVVDRAAAEGLGHEPRRPGQEAAITAVLERATPLA